MRAALDDDLAAAEFNLGQARLDETEVEKVLDFAENLLLNTATVWQQCSLEQKQREQVLFPFGVEYADGVYRTQETSFLFKSLGHIRDVGELNGSPYGNRTRITGLRILRPNR